MGKLIGKEEEFSEMVFNNSKIEQLKYKLNELIESKQHIDFDINENNQLLIHHERGDFL